MATFHRGSARAAPASSPASSLAPSPACRIVACANQKGGVGKTTTAFNLAAAMADRGSRVLLVDLDPQANTSITFGVQVEELHTSVADLLLHREVDVRYVTFQRGRLHLLPANLALEQAALSLQAVRLREQRLAQRLAEITHSYDLILIDCPPSIGLLTENALVAASEVLIPVDIGFYSLVGITQILGALAEIQESLNPVVRVTGLVATRVHGETPFTEAVLSKLRTHFPDQFFRTVIRYCEALIEAPSHGLSIFEYAPNSTGAQDYHALATEFETWSARHLLATSDRVSNSIAP